MAGDIAVYDQSYRSCAKHKDLLRKKQHKTKLFPLTGPLDDITLDLLGPLSKTRNDNHFIIVIAERYRKLTRTFPMYKLPLRISHP